MTKLIVGVFLFLCSLVSYAADYPVFKHFSDYTDMRQTKSSIPSAFRTHYKAKEKIVDREPSPAFKNNKWKLVMRRGIYRAEVEKMMSDVYQYFTGYATDLDFVEDNGDYYIARREFKSLTTWEDAVKFQDGHYNVNDYLLNDDGTLVKGNDVKRLTGVANIAVLTRFFSDSDSEMFNFGVQLYDDQMRVVDFDSEHALDFDDIKDEIDVERQLGDKFVNMAFYQQEKRAMLMKIARTDFSVIENIIRKNITVSRLDEPRWMFEKMLREPVYSEKQKAYARRMLKKISKLDESKFGVEQIVTEMKRRQDKIRQELNHG